MGFGIVDMVKEATRINITLSPEDYKLLKELKKKTEYQTSKLFSIALRFYKDNAKITSPYEKK